MDPRLAAAVAAFVEGQPMVVSGKCVELNVTRTTFYKYVARFREHGVDGFFPDSRRPRRSPTKLPVELEDVLIRIRKQEYDAGWDYGTDAVLLRLEEQPDLWPPDRRLPSRATVNRVFDARGQLDKVPQRRPRPRYRRFARERVNELWQYDGFDYRLADASMATVLHINDDCSRVDLALQAARSENSEDVWETFCSAVDEYQALPAAVLSDNGYAFSTRSRGSTNKFEAQLSALHIETITARIRHPQTCGKNERAHQRVIKWLDQQPQPGTLKELQQLLDSYREQFNNRRNLVLDKLTPNQRYTLGPFASPNPNHQAAVHVTEHVVGSRGCIAVDKTFIGLGRRHQGKHATAFRQSDHLTVFIEDQSARELTIDRTRRYQPQNR